MEIDKRGNIRVDMDGIKEFMKTNYSVYACDMVIINDAKYRLMISISNAGVFIVSIGSDMLYSGSDITRALQIFNLDIEGIKKIWPKINDRYKNTVVQAENDGLTLKK